MSTQHSPESERFMILQMVQDGTITPDEGARLLEAMDRVGRKPQSKPGATRNRQIHVRISDQHGSKKLDMHLPLGLVEAGINLANIFAPGRLPDLQEVRKSIDEGFTGPLVGFRNNDDLIEIIVNEGSEEL